MKFHRAILLFSMCFIFTLSTFSQDKTKSSLTITANVMILDSQDQFITDIKQEDIKIFEDGVEQKIISFSKKEPVLNVGLVIDNTGSMRETLDEVIYIGASVIENLRPADEAFIVRFVSRDKISVEADWTSNKLKLKSALSNLYIEGGKTAMIDALYLASQKILERERNDKSNRYALILISDSVDRDSYYKLNDLFGLTKNSDLQIFTFSYSEEDALKQIKVAKKSSGKKDKFFILNNIVATETGGTGFTLSENYTKEELQNKLKALILELRSNYVVSYTPTNSERDGKIRSLRVEIADGKNGEKRKGFIRDNYIAVEEKKITK